MRILLIITLLAASCMLPAQAPQWFTAGQVPGYSRNDNFIGLGEGGSFDEAQANAQAAIGSQLRVTVEATLDVFTRESQINDDVSFAEDIERQTRTSVQETMQGIQVVEQEKVGNKYYVFAVLNKSRFFSGLQTELSDIQDQVRKLLQDARRNTGEGMIHAALESFSEAYDQTLLFYTKKGFLDGLGGSAYFFEPAISPSEVIGEIRRVLSAIGIEILSGNNQSAPLGDFLPEPVRFIAQYEDKDGTKIPIRNIPVIVRAADNSLIERVNTNAQGTAEVQVRAVPSDGNRGQARAELDLRALSSAFRSFIRRAEIVVRYSVEEGAPIATRLRITNERGDRLDRLEQTVTRNLTALGFAVSDDAPFALVGVVTKVDEQQVDGMRGPQYVVNVELNLDLSVVSTGERFSGASFRGSGVSPRSADAALEASYTRIAINRREITNLMSGVQAKYNELQR